MRNAQGGTKKWCPSCEKIQVCTAVNPSKIAYESGQRWYKEDHQDINWFRRGLVCQSCNHEWLTAEVEENFLEELVELRDALSQIKVHAEAYAAESDKAANSLKKLGESLSVLRALKVYRS